MNQVDDPAMTPPSPEQRVASPKRRRRRRDRRPTGSIPSSLWAAMWVVVVAVLVAAVTGSLLLSRARTTLAAEVEAQYRTSVATGDRILNEEVQATERVLGTLFAAGATMSPQDPDMVELLASAMLGEEPDLMDIQVAAIARPNGEYLSVGHSTAAGSIGIATVVDGSLSWRPYRGGEPTNLPGFVVTERPWFVQAAAAPGRQQWAGPYSGLDGSTNFAVAIAHPGSGQSFMLNLPVSELGGAVDMAFDAPGSEAALVIVDDDGTARLAWSNTDKSHPELLEAVQGADVGKISTRRVGEGDNARFVSAGQLFPGNQSAFWVTTAPATSSVELSWIDFAVPSVFALMAVVLFGFGIAVFATRPMRRTAAAVAAGEEPPPSRISELEVVAAGVARLAAAVTENVDSESRLRTRIAKLVQRHDETKEADDMRTATELHDGPLQDVFGARWKIEVGDAAAAMSHLDSARDELRRITDDLTPDRLGQRELTDALADLADEMSEPGFDVVVDAADTEGVCEDVKLMLLRSARELIMNAKKYSGAPRVDVNLAATTSRVRLTVSDAGMGFDDGAESSGTFGLLSIRMAAEALGGSLTVGSSSSGGARVAVIVPLETEKK